METGTAGRPATPGGGATKPLEPRIVLEFLGAAAGIGAFVTVVGGAILWVRFDELGLPADRAVSLLPRQMLLTVGAHALIVPAIAGLGAVIAIYALEDQAQLVLDLFALVVAFAGVLVVENLLFDLSIGWGLLGPGLAAAAIAAAATWGAHKLSAPVVRKEKRHSLAVTFVVVAVAGVFIIGLGLDLPLIPDMLIVVLVALAGAATIFATARSPRALRG